MYINIRLLFITSSLLLVSCTNTTDWTPPENIQFWHSIPSGVVAEKVGDAVVSNGSGCGLFGTKGTEEVALQQLADKAIAANADAVLLTETNPPQLIGTCRKNEFIGHAVLYRLPNFSYTPPVEEYQIRKFSYTVPAGFDQAWTSLINAVSSDFFELSNYEKDSGLMTLDFSPDSPNDYVQCGNWQKAYNGGLVDFSGSYVDWLHKEDPMGVDVEIKINLRVQEVSASRTQIEINALYRVNSSTIDFKFKTNKRSVKSSKESPVTIDNTRICQSTLKLEKDLMATIKRLAST